MNVELVQRNYRKLLELGAFTSNTLDTKPRDKEKRDLLCISDAIKIRKKLGSRSYRYVRLGGSLNE